jgi:Tfp pilus assembly major pilin PilA
MSLTGGKRKVNKSLKAWVAFVKKVQKEEKLSYKDAIHRAKQRKDKGEKWMKGGATDDDEATPSPTATANPTTTPATATATANDDDMYVDETPEDDMSDNDNMTGGRRRRRTMRRSRGHKRRTARRARGRASRRH